MHISLCVYSEVYIQVRHELEAAVEILPVKIEKEIGFSLKCSLYKAPHPIIDVRDINAVHPSSFVV